LPEPIPGSRREAEAIARYVSPGSKVYVGAQASEGRIKQEDLSRYRIVHFATHGFVSRENPGRSALLLAASPSDREDGVLEAREISALALDSDLVVLSGCETARGRILAGEGVQSLARAFFLAGARSVVASLWKVRDQATEELMAAFYRDLAEGLPEDEALREAKLELSKKAPARDWASFVLIGEAAGTIALTPRR
jgi:CHAT domain-containing protein